jgi:hypothetical protein
MRGKDINRVDSSVLYVQKPAESLVGRTAKMFALKSPENF